ncbi:DEAD/DEAH box helicase family protein [Actinomyces sp. 594]|uniref:DEAD/DEAH box helicase family protein n=1 Tax=Actinomyces sp. 594 TaxID=2057793 RepID=UPI001C55E408|nr:DEAD/DEAH box helicase family protein [Actinomyces sp. 594]MBW3068412.1 DEAD/DEAH box helicase family protein [Actinomyces sp. 594]
MAPQITLDVALVDEIAARFDLRAPNRDALKTLVERLGASEDQFVELVADLATGVGKTFLMSALIEYLAQQGVRHVLVVTPGSTIQAKTVANFDAASAKYVEGADIPPFVITPENFQTANVGMALRDGRRLKVFVFNVQQLLRPTAKVSRKTRQADETLGQALYEYLENTDDLYVIADEHHVYHEKAKAFSAALRDLHPRALIGLTATPDPADTPKIAYEYTLGEAIADGYVKTPVIVYRPDGTHDERSQLTDACQLLRRKEEAYAAHRALNPDAPKVRPVLFVVGQTIEHAHEVAQMLAQPGLIGDGAAVLEVTSQSSDEALDALSHVEDPDSPIRAIVSVNMLREGWDVKNIAVIVALRRLASQALTEQILGRGLRLPFGRRTGIPMVDQVDLVAHDSYRQLLAQKDILTARTMPGGTAPNTDATGAAPVPHIPDATPGEEADNTTSEAGSGSGAPETPTATDNTDQGTTGTSTDTWDMGNFMIQEVQPRTEQPAPAFAHRTDGAPTITFPRWEAVFEPAVFRLASIPLGDARAVGARFIHEIPTWLSRDALEAAREANHVTITTTPQQQEEAQQPLVGLNTIRAELIAMILHQPEVTASLAEKNGAKAIVNAFLTGAGVTSENTTAEWGIQRQQFAADGLARLIRERIANRPSVVNYRFRNVTLPLEPVPMDANAPNAYDTVNFVKHQEYCGWQHNIMPTASFDAATTEWALAKLLDRDPNITWWLRIYTDGDAFIPLANGRYFPDFIALDKDGTHWVIEGKSDKNANDPNVQAKKEAAETWARDVNYDGQCGTWRYMFATETSIKNSGNSWYGLLLATNPDQ